MIILWLFERAIYLSQISEPLHEGYQPVQKTNKQTKKIIQEKEQREKSCCLSNRGAPQQFWCCCANCCRMLKSTTKKNEKKRGKKSMLQQWHTAIQAGLRDKGQKMICHWHNCIPRSCVSVAPAFHRLLFTLHSSPDGKVILKTQKFIVATHRGNGSWGVGVGDGGGGQRKREGPARLEWSRRVTLASLKDGAS